jgi:hypothetical protein
LENQPLEVVVVFGVMLGFALDEALTLGLLTVRAVAGFPKPSDFKPELLLDACCFGAVYVLLAGADAFGAE